MATTATSPPSRRAASPWHLALLLCLIASDGFSHGFVWPRSALARQCPSPGGTRRPQARPHETTKLNYAPMASNDGGPMSKVDSSKSGGCPFLDTSYAYKTYAVPALFNDEDSRPIVLFDGECNLCNGFVQMLLKHDSCRDDERGNLRFAALQSRVGELLLRRMSDELRAKVVAENAAGAEEAGEEVERYKSIVVCGPEKTFIQSSAVLQILASLGGPSKRLKLLQYLALVGYVLPTRLRDGMYNIVSRRRKKWFGKANECLLWDERFETRFVDDGVLTGTFRDPFADPNAKVVPTSVNLFEGEDPPVRGDRVRIIWPADSDKNPSVSYDDEFPDGICIAGGEGTISTVDLPMRVVMRVDRKSIGLEPTEKGEETMIAWVKPEEVAAL